MKLESNCNLGVKEIYMYVFGFCVCLTQTVLTIPRESIQKGIYGLRRASVSRQASLRPLFVQYIQLSMSILYTGRDDHGAHNINTSTITKLSGILQKKPSHRKISKVSEVLKKKEFFRLFRPGYATVMKLRYKFESFWNILR